METSTKIIAEIQRAGQQNRKEAAGEYNRRIPQALFGLILVGIIVLAGSVLVEQRPDQELVPVGCIHCSKRPVDTLSVQPYKEQGRIAKQFLDGTPQKHPCANKLSSCHDNSSCSNSRGARKKDTATSYPTEVHQNQGKIRRRCPIISFGQEGTNSNVLSHENWRFQSERWDFSIFDCLTLPDANIPIEDHQVKNKISASSCRPSINDIYRI